MREAVDIAIIGAGPAGLAAAVAAKQAGASRVLLLERNPRVGGVLPQCVHDGFGLHVFGTSMTGPEYAREWERRAANAQADVVLSAAVLSIRRLKSQPEGASDPFEMTVASESLGGVATVKAKSLVLATGCYERTRGALGLPGTRPSGVMTAGTAQYLMNMQNELPGDKAVILGSGDVGLIMARRLTLEGAQVRMVLGIEGTGLLRNHIRCIEDFAIPFRYGWGIASIHGRGQLKGVTIAPYLEDGTLDMTRKEYLRANLLLIACGLVPELQLLDEAEIDLRDAKDGRIPGLFVCGNATTPHDLVDQVTQEGLRAGLAAADYATDAEPSLETLDADLRKICSMDIVEARGSLKDVSFGSNGTERTTLVPCTVCPTGCIIEAGVDPASRKVTDVSGNACKRGRDYATTEVTHPTRLFTGTVCVAPGPLSDEGAQPSRAAKLLPVRTSRSIPRESLEKVAKTCRRIRVEAPVAAGQVIRTNIANTGADLIACADIEPAASVSAEGRVAVG